MIFFLAKTGEQPPEKRAKFEYSVQTKEEEGETLIQNEAVIINTESQNSQVHVTHRDINRKLEMPSIHYGVIHVSDGIIMCCV